MAFVATAMRGDTFASCVDMNLFEAHVHLNPVTDKTVRDALSNRIDINKRIIGDATAQSSLSCWDRTLW